MKRGGISFICLILLLGFVGAQQISSEQIYDLNGKALSENFVLNLGNQSNIELVNVEISLNNLKKLNLVKNFILDGSTFFISFNPELKLNQLIVSERGLSLVEATDSYIVEFKEPSILEKKNGLEKEIYTLKKEVSSENVRVVSSVSNLVQKEKEISSFEMDYKSQLVNSHNQAINQFSSSLDGGLDTFFLNFFLPFNFLKPLYSPSFVVEEEYFSTFNGVTLKNLDVVGAEKIRKLNFVKSVVPNKKVYVDLSESVPLIQDGIPAGQLDSDGNDCLVSGKTCLDGSGISIGIIDTGVDYTHPDLGGCFGENCKVAGGYDFVNHDENPMDDHGHGTHVASTAAGKSTSGGGNVAETFEVAINLSLGESFFSIPIESDSSFNITEATDGACPYARFWRGATQSYISQIILSSGIGYDIYCNRNVSFIVQGTSLSNLDTKLVSGWNLVGTRQGINGASIKSLINGCDLVGNINVFENGRYVTKLPSDLVEVGKAYYLFCNSPGVWDSKTEVLSSGSLNGVAPGATIYAYKVLDSEGSGSTSEIISAIERSVDPNQDGDFSDKLDIISLSLGGGGNPDDPISISIDNAVKAGVVAVVAAGNDGPWKQSIGSPGTARNALTVGAIDKNKTIAEFSSRGPVIWEGGLLNKPDVVAPGVDICAAQWDSAWEENQCLDDKHTSISGTSMATPHVAGAVAIIKQSRPELDSFQLKSLIKLTAKDLGYDVNTQGSGLVNIPAALNSPIIFSGDLSFGNLNSFVGEREITISNLKDFSVEVSLFVSNVESESGDFFDVLTSDETSFILEAKSSKTFSLVLDTTDLSQDGSFNGDLVLSVGENEFKVPYSFGIFSKLNLNFPGHYPYFRIYNDGLTSVYGLSQGETFFGGETSIFVKSGTYTVYAINDFVNAKDPRNYPETTEYIIGKKVDVPFREEGNLNFGLNDGRIFTFAAKDRYNKELMLYEWQKGIGVYTGEPGDCDKYSGIDESSCLNNPERLVCRANVFDSGYVSCEDYTLSSTFGTSDVLGDRKIYLSNNPNENVNVDVLIKYWGAPYVK